MQPTSLGSIAKRKTVIRFQNYYSGIRLLRLSLYYIDAFSPVQAEFLSLRAFEFSYNDLLGCIVTSPITTLFVGPCRIFCWFIL